jgi:hypothetical protein
VIATAIETKGDRMNTRKGLVGTIAVAAALVILPVAQARHGDDQTTLHRSVGASGTGYVVPAGSNEAIVNDAGRATSNGVRPDDRAGLRGVGEVVVPVTRPDDRAGVRGPGPVPVHSAVAATTDGFDWVDALVGGAGGVATALLVMGGALLLLTQRNKTRTA